NVVIVHAMAQYQILSPGRRTYRISLDKAEVVESTFQRCGLKKAATDRQSAEVINRSGHGSNKLRSPSGARVVDVQPAGIRKYPQIRPNHIDDKVTCSQEWPT